MFKNSRTGQTAAELRAYSAEDEASAKLRLSGQGWSFPPDYVFDDKKKVFTLKVDEPDSEETDSDGE
jgi:hypothetical protein